MKRARANEPQQVSTRETEILLELAARHLALSGDVVELGCYRGDTSLLLERLLEERESVKTLWIYDSFAGLPAKSAEDASVAGEQFQKGELLVTKREVVEKFRSAGLRLPVIRKGFFEELDAKKDLPGAICFGFLDGDLYESIRTSLKLCAPKVVPGGVLVVHDYNNPELPGVAKAVEEFLKSSCGQKARLSQRESLAILRF